MKKIISTLLISIGFLIIFYPKISNYYYDYKQKQVLQQMQFSYEENSSKNGENITLNEATKETAYVIKIHKINLYQPILEGSNEENLKISISTINKNANPGDVGNYALAGHRSQTYGRNFNRLDEINLGDEIKIYKNSKEYTYVIDKKFTVKPHEVWVLKGDEKHKELTLITCDPPINPNSRLILKGKLVEK